MNALYQFYQDCRQILRLEFGIVGSEKIAIQVNECFAWEPVRAAHTRIVSVWLDHKICDPPIELDSYMTVDEPDYEKARHAFVYTFVPKLKTLLKT